MKLSLGPMIVSKELILSRVTEETLMEHYVGVPCKKGLFRSPFRTDRNPTCCFFRNKKGELLFKDFGSDLTGNFITIVMHKFSCSYGKALQIIANDFNIVKSKLTINKPAIKYTNAKFEQTEDAVIQIETKPFSEYELKWWSKFGITEKTLKKFRVFSCKNVFLNGELFHLYKDKQLVFGYYGGIREGIERCRVYFPGRKKLKFISNWKSFRLQGAHLLPKDGDYVVVTKSLKDCAVLHEFDIPAIAPISENCYLTEAQHSKLVKRFKHVILFYDNDIAGVHNLNKFRKMHPELYPCWIPRKYDAKDISDFYAKYGKEKTLEIIEHAKEEINREYERRYGKEKKES